MNRPVSRAFFIRLMEFPGKFGSDARHCQAAHQCGDGAEGARFQQIISGEVLLLRSPDHQMSRSPDFAALCLCPSARAPPPIGVLLKTKAKVQFDRAVEALFLSFLPTESVSFCRSFYPCN